MSGEDAADAAVGHAATETHAWAVAPSGVQEFDCSGTDNDCDHKDGLPNHPKDELSSTEEAKELVQTVCGFANGAKNCY